MCEKSTQNYVKELGNISDEDLMAQLSQTE